MIKTKSFRGNFIWPKTEYYPMFDTDDISAQSWKSTEKEKTGESSVSPKDGFIFFKLSKQVNNWQDKKGGNVHKKKLECGKILMNGLIFSIDILMGFGAEK